jgi:hypothetical protein
LARLWRDQTHRPSDHWLAHSRQPRIARERLFEGAAWALALPSAADDALHALKQVALSYIPLELLQGCMKKLVIPYLCAFALIAILIWWSGR